MAKPKVFIERRTRNNRTRDSRAARCARRHRTCELAHRASQGRSCEARCVEQGAVGDSVSSRRCCAGNGGASRTGGDALYRREHRTSNEPRLGLRFSEMTRTQRATIASAQRVSNPGCYPTGALALLRPLRERGICSRQARLLMSTQCPGISGGGRRLMTRISANLGEARPAGDDRSVRAQSGAQAFARDADDGICSIVRRSLRHTSAISCAGCWYRFRYIPASWQVASRASHCMPHTLITLRMSLITVCPLNDSSALRDGAYLEPEALNRTNRIENIIYQRCQQAEHY